MFAIFCLFSPNFLGPWSWRDLVGNYHRGCSPNVTLLCKVETWGTHCQRRSGSHKRKLDQDEDVEEGKTYNNKQLCTEKGLRWLGVFRPRLDGAYQAKRRKGREGLPQSCSVSFSSDFLVVWGSNLQISISQGSGGVCVCVCVWSPYSLYGKTHFFGFDCIPYCRIAFWCGIVFFLLL